MKHLVTFVFFAVCLSVKAQLLAGPESIVFDVKHNRYLVSCRSDSLKSFTIIQTNLKGKDEKMFVTLQEGERPAGLEIVGNTLFVATNKPSLLGFDLKTGNRVFDQNGGINTGKFNGLASSKSGQLFLSDPANKSVYEVDVKTGDFKLIAKLNTSINGLRFDETNNSLLVCGWGNPAIISSVNLTTNGVVTVYQGVVDEFLNIDAIAIDHCGNYYASMWSAGKIVVFKDGWKTNPTLFLEGLQGPADIDYDFFNKKLLIPEIKGNKIQIVDVKTKCEK